MSGRFEILASSGTDLLAVDLRGGAPRAVLLAPVVREVADDPARLARLAAAVEACARLFHPSVLAPLSLEGFGDGLAVVHPFREGVTVREMLDAAGRLPPDVAVRIAVDACAGLAHLHAKNGPDDRPLAHGGLVAGSLLVIASGETVVTGLCAERAAEAEPADDVLALGKVLYECLAGEPPPVARRPLDAPGVPAALAAAVERALAGERSAEALSRALAQAVEPAARGAAAAYADAIVPADEGARAERRKLVARAAPPAREQGAEEVAEDAIVGEPTPVPGVADELIVGEITPDPSRRGRQAPGQRAEAPGPPPAESPAAPLASPPAPELAPGPAPLPATPPGAPTREVRGRRVAPAARSRAPLVAALLMAAAGFAAGFALTRWAGTAPAGPAPGAVPAASRPAASSAPALHVDPAPPPTQGEAPAPALAAPPPAPSPQPGETAAPAPRKGGKPSIQVTADPPGDVYVDGKKAGRTPVKVPVSRGTHEVRLRERSLGIDLSRRVSVRGPDTPVRFTPGKGTLVVSAPDDVEVFLDGRRVGRGDLTLELYEGEHRVEVRLGDARTGERFRLSPGERYTYEVTPAPGE